MLEGTALSAAHDTLLDAEGDEGIEEHENETDLAGGNRDIDPNVLLCREARADIEVHSGPQVLNNVTMARTKCLSMVKVLIIISTNNIAYRAWLSQEPREPYNPHRLQRAS